MKKDDEVVGILCSVCRQQENFFSQEGRQQRERNQGKFTTVPLSKMGDLYEQARTHEFGNVASVNPREYRQKILNGSVPVPTTAHTTFHLAQETALKAHATNTTIDCTMKKIGTNI